MTNAILTEVFTDVDLSQEDFRIISASLEKVDLKKGEILLRRGQTVSHTYYVYDGCLRSYFVDDSGKDHTLQFAIKDWWISDYTALFLGGKAMMNIECIQDTHLYKLSRKKMEQLYIDIPEFETFFRKKLENRVAAFHRRTLDNIALSAKERYISFVNAYPNIEQKIKNYHIASYLGIATESLSRVRKEIAQ